MDLCRILVDSCADGGLTNAQMSNAREIICRLDPQRFRVTVFHRNAPDARIVARPNTRFIPLPERRQSATILKTFLSGQQDIIFYLKASPAAKWYMRLRGMRADGCITVGTVESRSNLIDEPTILPEVIRLWEQTVLRCDCLFSNSRAVAQHLAQYYGLASEIIPTGVDTSYFVPNDRKTAGPARVLFVGSLRPFKRPDLLLDAAARFPNAEFVIVGDGVMRADLANRVHRENLRNVKLCGALGCEEVRDHYQNADIFLFPSTWEGSPKVILEAAACGLPVIARRSYQPETVLNGATGFLVDSDEESLVRLDLLLKDLPFSRSLGTAGRKLSERFDWDSIAERWQETFLRLWRNKRKGRAA
jgi:glycosyltransferase involved in cell wall biosynthesis